MPADFVERWQRQQNTPYGGLSESEQDSDRKEADKFLAIFDTSPAEESDVSYNRPLDPNDPPLSNFIKTGTATGDRL